MRGHLVLVWALACHDDKESPPAESPAAIESAPGESGETGAPVALPRLRSATVTVTLDGAPVEGAVVTQGGNPARWTTGADGTALVSLDTAVRGAVTIMAAHPEARNSGEELGDNPAEVDERLASPIEIPLLRYDPNDNPDYVFLDPGDPDHRDSTGQCAHCHLSLNDAWYRSAHRSSASNPVVHDLYAGAAAAWSDEASCVAAGGQWWEGLEPGTGSRGYRCYVGDGALPALNTDCGEVSPCDGVATQTGGCADCHAPGLDGVLGGRDLLEATAFAYSYGVHCDVCHRVESVDLDAAPGVAGALKLLRPSEVSTSPVLGDWEPLTFGPYPDVINPKMGSVARDHFLGAEFCGGCHQLTQAPAVPGTAADPARWPDGEIPIQTTYAEWKAGPYASGAPCQSCHMPPDAGAGNSADLGRELPDDVIDSSTGWYRPPGTVRLHTWTGPRSPDSPMLRLAGALSVTTALEDGADGEELVVSATVTNAGAGHAFPTGEPMRHLVLHLQVTCDGAPLAATGGDAVPDMGGWLDRKEAGEDWMSWPDASPGDVLRVVRRTGAWHDYTGYGPFGDGTFSAEDKGMPVEEVVGQATILAVDGDAVTLDQPLPDGDIVYRGEADALPDDGDPSSAVAGAPGFAWGRVMVDAEGDRGVPGFLAVDVASDNRLLPQQSWTSTHRYAHPCAAPEVVARLTYRSYPLSLARERGWDAIDRLVAEASP